MLKNPFSQQNVNNISNFENINYSDQNKNKSCIIEENNMEGILD
jgi:hypothetical protein